MNTNNLKKKDMNFLQIAINNNKTRVRSMLLLLTSLVCFQSITAQVYVDNAATGANDGSSWANAYTDLQEVFDLVDLVGYDVIQVAQGTYYPSSSPDGTLTDPRNKAFHLATDVVVKGGYDPVTGTQTGAATILSGDNDNNYHVMVNTLLTSATVFDALTFKDGNANGSGANDISFGGTTFDNRYGGGIYNKASSPTYTNCVFTDNQATINGGGLYVTSSSNITIENCTFTTNNSLQNGGGIGNAFNSTVTISNSLFESNTSNNGGGLANISTGNITIENCVFFQNIATSEGGGFYNTSTSIVELTNNTFTANSTSGGNSGGGISVTSNTEIKNTILWDNGLEIIGVPVVSNSIVQGGYVGCIDCPNTDGNIDPNFLNATNLSGVDNILGTIDDGLNLLGNSDAIDAGTSFGAPFIDFGEFPRVGNPDIGAYEAEFQPTELGEVLKFDGVDDYISWNSIFSFVSSYTVEAWVKFDSDPAGQNILVMTDDPASSIGCENVLKVTDEGYLTHVFLTDLLEYDQVTHPLKLQPHVWYYFSIFSDYSSSPNELGITINDETIINSDNIRLPDSGISKILIGAEACASTSFDGEIDELRIWSQVENTMNQEDVAGNPALISYFKFDEGIGGQDNTNPLLNTMTDPYNSTVATLHNFTLSGTESNWMPCGPFDLTDSEFPINTLVEQVVGDDMVLTSSIPGAPPSATYQWYKDGLPISGDATTDVETPTLFIPNVEPSDAGEYYFGQTLDGICTVFSEHKDVVVRGTGEVLNFDGENDHFVIETISFIEEFTIELWVKFEDNVTLQNIITGSDNSGPNAAVYNQLYTDQNGHVVLFVIDNVGQQYKMVSDNALLPNQWYHIAASVLSGATTFTLMIDGVVNSDQPAAPALMNLDMTRFYVGSEATSLDNTGNISLSPFKGEIDELRIWDEGRTIANIQTLMNTELNFNSIESRHYFRFNQGLANSSNSNPEISNLPDYKDVDIPKLNVTELIGFSLEGENSNWSDCSPVTNAVLNYSLKYQPQIGQDLEIDVFVERGDTSELTFEWLFDGNPIVGETNPLYGKTDITTADLGLYEVIVTDFCDPPFIDTVLVTNLQENCYGDLPHQILEYSSQTSSVGCLGPDCTSPFKLDSLFGSYCGDNVNYEGSENIFKITLPEPKVLDITMNNSSIFADIFVFNDACDVSTCLGSNTEDVALKHLQVAVPAGDNYIIVDSRTPISSGLNLVFLNVEIYDTKCHFSTALDCGEEVTGNTANGVGFLSEYCNDVGYSGTEQTYEIVLQEPQTLLLELTNLSADLDIFLMDSTCSESICLNSATLSGNLDETLIYGAKAGTYYIVVDGKNGVTGTFDLSINCQDYFSASIDETDAYIDLDWAIDKQLCVPQDTGVLIKLVDQFNNTLFEQEYTTAALTPDVITGTYRHVVGDNHTRGYVLRVYNRLSNVKICEEFKTGSTLPFQAPELISISNAAAADSIEIVWRNHSHLSDQFRIYRDGNQIASLSDGYAEDSLIVAYVDSHDMNDALSIDSANTYNYCIETYNNSLAQAYTQLCADGSLSDIGFSATDGGTSDMISLTWNDVSDYSEGIKISRDGIQLQLLSPLETYYNDLTPIYGATTEYSLTILRGGDEIITTSDDGYIDANGSISGKVQTAEGGYPVHETDVMLYKDSLIQGVVTEVLVSTVTTDYQGQFSFQDIFYRLADDFRIQAIKTGSTFAPSIIELELNGAVPQVDDLLFEDESEVISEETPVLLDTFFTEVLNDEDQIILHWDYVFTGVDTTFLTLKRDGVLIFEGNDSDGMLDSFIDITGVPGYDYTYTLEAFQYVDGLIKTAVRTQLADYPVLTPVSDLNFELGAINATPDVQSFDPRIFFDWTSANHPSLNFDGFRIFRNNILVGDIAFDSPNTFEYLSAPGLEGAYSIRTYKKIDGATYESSKYPNNDTLITSHNLWTPQISSTASSDRALIIDIASYTPAFYNEAIYDGIFIERKVSGTDDSTYVNIGTLTKVNIGALANMSSEPQIWDTYGKPDTIYTYKVSTYSDVGADRYLASLIFDRTSPVIEGPTNISKIEEVGKVNLIWEDNSLTAGPQNQQYINYTGYILTRKDITNNGFVDTIATYLASAETYQDYISNPVYNAFLDDYFSTNFQYGLQGYFDIEDTRYYSASLLIDAKPLDGSTLEPLPSDFVGSHNIPGHIKLCWSWEAAKLSEFIIYRGQEAIDTMPTTARAYYDYDAPADPSVPYRIASLHSGNLSEFVLTDGSMPSAVSISGRVSNFYTGVGIQSSNIIYENIADAVLGVTAGQYTGFATTDLTGNYRIENVPSINGLELVVAASGNNIDFDSTAVYQTSKSSPLVLIESGDYTIDFVEYTTMDTTDGVSPIAAVNVIPNAIDMNVAIKWSPENGNYDGFQIYRANALIGEVKKGEGFTWIDEGGFPGIQYVWSVKAFQNSVSGRQYSDPTPGAAVFPALLPVENMTVTAFSEMNRMRVSWSHPLDAHDSYRVRRNGDFMASIPTGSTLMWYDSTGIPGIEYQYEVSAIKGANISVPVVVTTSFKGVGEVSQLAAAISNAVACLGVVTTENHVHLSWEYLASAADGFEIFRDGELIADIKGAFLVYGDAPLSTGDTLVNGNNAYYDDYAGTPDISHAYHVLPYVIREGGRYSSGIEELVPTETVTYPEIAIISNLEVVQNNVFGSAQISFIYDTDIVDGFEILRDGIILDTLLSSDSDTFSFQDFTGIPGSIYEYSVRAFDTRSESNYYSQLSCNGSVEFPTVPVPQNLTASQGTFQNHVEVTWVYSLMASVDSFYLENSTKNEIVSFALGSRKHLDVVQNIDFEKFTYKIRASKLTAGQEVFSDWSNTTEGWSQSQINGGQDEMLDPDFGYTELGTASAIDGDWAVSIGTRISTSNVGGENKILNIYNRKDGGWSLFQSILNGDFIHFSSKLSISNGKLAVRSTENNILIYTFNGVDWGYPISIDRPGTSFGANLDLDGDQLIASDNDKIVIYNFFNNQWSQIFSSTPSVSSPTIYEVSIDDNVAAYTYINSTFETQILNKVNGAWAEATIPVSLIGYSEGLEVNDNTLVIGNSNQRRVIIADIINGAVVETFVLNKPVNSPGDFGKQQSVSKIPSPIDDVTYVLIGDPSYDGLDDNTGKIYLYTNLSGSFELLFDYENNTQNINDRLGASVAISKDAIIFGTPGSGLYKQGKVQIINLLDAPVNVQATKELSIDNDPTETTVSWDFQGNQDLLAGFNIYRDDEFLIYRDKATAINTAPNTISDNWNDNSGNAGQHYIYSVKSVNNNIPFESYGGAAEGYNRANGTIRGSVTTQLGAVPVPGVTIVATGIVDGEVYAYTSTTLPNGEYTFSTVFYDANPDNVTQYEVTAEYQDHIIIPQTTNSTILNPLNDPTQGIVNFFDITAFVIKGSIVQPDVNCPIEGIKVTAIKNGLPQTGQEAFTDADGNYSLVINPNEANLQEIRVRIEQEVTTDQVTTTYNFVPDADTTFTNFINFPLITEVNFTDELTYDVALNVKNTCDDAISTGKWNVRVRTLDGCFDEVYQTNSNGDLVVPLIPLNYTMSVVGVDVPSSVNQQALDYYANFPVALNLLDTHRDSIDELTHAEIEDLSERTFVFHQAPEINVVGLDDLICNTQTAILEQGLEYTLSFDISEIFDGNNCSVTEGIIEISNPASTDNEPVIVPYNDLLEKFDDYTFTAGGPSQIFPHAYAVTFDYKSVDGNFLGRLTRVVFVEGTVAIPGTDIIVDAASGNDAVPYPLMVLRDPPGDHSSSYIEAAQSISFETEMTMEDEIGASVYAEASVEIFEVGLDIDASISGGYTSEESISFENTITTTSRISTSDDEDNIGRGADIMVGTGMVMQFGLINEYKVGGCDEIVKTTQYGISPNAASTVWSYQISQIEDILQGYQNDVIRVNNNTLLITRNDVELTKEESLTFLNSNISNWEQVLEYHDVKTVPHYVLCTLEPNQYISEENKIAIQEWQTVLIPLFGSMQNGTFVLNPDVIWTQELMDVYNAASAAIRVLNTGIMTSSFSLPDDIDPNDPDLDITEVDFSYVLDSPVVTSYSAEFGDLVKNITTGGNITIEESVNNGQASTTSHTSSFYLGTELDVSHTFGGSEEIVVGTFAGVGGGVTFATVRELFKTEVKVGVTAEAKFTRSNEFAQTAEESVEVGYSIMDDDNLDAFSFAVIQGIAPNMTPYFDYFGGHSSCPPEEGSVFVDNPKIAILDLASGGTSQTKELYNVPADETAIFYVIVENQTPIASLPTRELEVSLESGSNDNGAIIKLNGVSLNGGSYIDSLDAFSPDTLILTIEKGPNFFDYPDLQIGMEPVCGEGPRQYIYASVYFANPCSPVTLIAPDENWVLNDDTTKIVVGMQDYDPGNPFFVDATLQYRRLGAGQEWTDVNPLELENGNYITPAELLLNDSQYAAGQTPKYFFIWTVPTTGTYPDGQYELRTSMQCDNFTSTLSNVIGGTIARDGLNLFGSPQPADQLWTTGDEISFTFNKDLDCALLTDAFIANNVSLIDESTGLEVGFTLSCYANKVIFVLDEAMSTYDGKSLTMSVTDITSLEGNVSMLHTWTFRVITQKIYWADADTIKLRMYQDDADQLIINLNNTTDNETISGLSFVAEDGAFGDWLVVTDPTTPSFSVNPSGRAVTFDIDASEPVGIYNETINVLGAGAFGNTPQVHIQLEVLVKPPNWVVNPGDFATSMNMITNWKYDSDPVTEISTDIADLISVWVGNEIRGVAPISQAGEFFASYLTIYGSVEDGVDTPLEFRVWDADTGLEYDGHATDTIFYIANSTRGTTANPEVLNVATDYDRARYVYLRQGWTGFSLTDSTTNMSVMHKLRTLGTVSEGDLIVTDDKFSQYTDSLGWFNFGSSNLSSLDNNDGYMIYLENGPDTLRITGTAPTLSDITLKSGWNWLGFPMENPESLNAVLNMNAANTTGDDRIKIDFPLPGETAKFANYSLANDNWNDGNITNLEPNNLYKLYSGHPNGAILSWDPENNFKGQEIEASSFRSSIVADPNDASTWVMPDFTTDEVMPVIAEVVVDGVIADGAGDKVAFFENDTIRALAEIQYLDGLMAWEFSILAEESMVTYDIRYYDASEGAVYQALNELTFNRNGVGTVLDPYEIIIEADTCMDLLILGPTGNPFVSDRTFEARQEIRVRGNLSIPTGVNIILSAPIVTIEDQLENGTGANIIVRPDGCN